MLIVDKRDGYAVVTLNRPKANALSLEVMTELGDAMKALDDDPDAGAIIITGGEGKFFSAGADVPTLQASLDNPFGDGLLLSTGIRTVNEIESSTTPVIAAVNGIALGGGCELCLACHMRVASDEAKFGQPEINLGIVPGWGGTHRLPRLIGEARAMDWLLTGRVVSAQEALEAGLISKMVPASSLMETAEECAKLVASKPAVAKRVTLRAVLQRALHPAQGVQLEADAFKEAAQSADAREGIAAFLEKREAKFTNQ